VARHLLGVSWDRYELLVQEVQLVFVSEQVRQGERHGTQLVELVSATNGKGQLLRHEPLLLLK
jgi:hypothetical protein